MSNSVSLASILLSCSIAVLSIVAVILTTSQHQQIQELKQQIDDIQLQQHQRHRQTYQRGVDDVNDETILPIVTNDNEAMEADETSRELLKGDGTIDMTFAIQKKLNKAKNDKKGGVVTLPHGIFLITDTITIPAGVTLQGKGYGSSPLAIQFDNGGTTLAYCGEGYAVKIDGHSSVLRNIAVYDWRYPEGEYCDTVKGKGGVQIVADDSTVESVILDNVFIYWFMGGTSLTLEAKNEGGIAFGAFQNVRIRHAKRGIDIIADETSFVNSNAFHDGVISGGVTEVGLSVNCTGACNQNAVNDMAIEPPSTEITHVYIKGSKSNIRMNDVRLEGTALPLDHPIIIIEDDSYNNVINGMIGHTFIQADFNRNPEIDVVSNKFVGVDPAQTNLFWNAAFHGLQGTYMPGWSHITSPANHELSIVPDEELFPNHNTLRVTYLNFGGVYKLKPSNLPSSPIHSFCTFGIYARTNDSNAISAAMKYDSGSTIASSSHTGSGKWEFIGMSALYDKTTGPLPYFSIEGDVDLAAPVFTYGSSPAVPGAEFMSSSGATMSGVLSMSVVSFAPPEDSNLWVLPQEGNLFEIQPFADTGDEVCTTSYKYVTRINDATADRFPAGSVITVLFPECGDCVPCLQFNDGGYIKLLGGVNFSPGPVPNSSITLVSLGSGVWKEIGRNV